MLNDDELGFALRQALGEMLDDIEPSEGLAKRVEEIPTRDRKGWRGALRRQGHRRLLAAVPIPIAAIAAGVIVFGGSDVAPSFAVTSEPDGGVQVTIDDLTGVSGANARLRALGVRAVIVPMTDDCGTHISLTYEGIAEQPAPSIKLMPSEIPAGTTIVLGAQQTGPNSVEMAFGRVTGPPPPCVAPNQSSAGPGTSVSPISPNSSKTTTEDKS